MLSAGGEHNKHGLWPVPAMGFGDLLARKAAQVRAGSHISILGQWPDVDERSKCTPQDQLKASGMCAAVDKLMWCQLDLWNQD